MPIQITRPGKRTLFIDSPVMPAAGTTGFAFEYDGLLKTEKLGAIVTNPVTYEPWSPASGTRVVPMDAGALVHTGLPNPGLSRVIKEYQHVWGSLPVPTIVHLVGTLPEQVEKAVQRLNQVDSVAAVELGLDDDIGYNDAHQMVKAATYQAEKPVLVRLPAYEAYHIAQACIEADADALVVAAPPRGTARDTRTGKLVSGRVYGPPVKPMILRMVGVLARRIKDVPIIGAGGIHSLQDARDYLEAGAVAVQIDSATWVQPRILERIARDLSGGLVTRASDAYPDEWHPDMGDTEFRELFSDDDD
jgi:dihydroorotate dehydrogenase (NAD+) catalytic subunit